MNTFTFALIGESGVGKSTLVERHATGEYTVKHTKTRFSDGTRIVYNTPVGYVSVIIREYTYEANALPTLEDDVDGVMVMFDQTRPDTLWNSLGIIDNIQDTYTGLPIVLVGGKSDVRKRKFYHDDIVCEARELGVKYDGVSSLTNNNIEKPILRLLREALSIPTLHFIECESLLPPPTVRKVDMNRIWKEIERANAASFPDIDDITLLDVLNTEVDQESRVIERCENGRSAEIAKESRVIEQCERNQHAIHLHTVLGRIQPRAKL